MPAHGRPRYSNMVADLMAGYSGMVEDGLYDFTVTWMVEIHHHCPLFMREVSQVLKVPGRVLAFIQGDHAKNRENVEMVDQVLAGKPG